MLAEMDTVLCIPTSKVPVLLDMYHSSAMGGHVGITQVLSDHKSKILLPQLSRTIEHIHYWFPCVSAVQER